MNYPTTDPQSSEKIRVLVMMRPYLFEDFRDSFAPLPNRFEVYYLTDSPRRGVADTTALFYKNVREDRRSPEIDDQTEDEVIARCRLLRNLPRARASNLLHAMALSIAARFDEVRPHTVVCQLIDEYVTHLFNIIARGRGLEPTQIGPSYFNNQMLTTQLANGTPRNVRMPETAEASEALQRLKDVRHRRNYTLKDGYSFRRHCWQVLRYHLKLAVFWTAGRLKKDPLYVHYAILPFLAERRRFSDYPDMKLFSSDWREKVRLRRNRSNTTVVYLPLSYSPEATIDYWIADTRMIEYEAMTLKMLRALGEDSSLLLVVKDHVHMMGMRPRNFYRELANIPSVVLVPPGEYGNEVLQEIDCVLLGGGSTGVEAMVHGKPVATYCDTSYWYGPSGATFVDTKSMSEWIPDIKKLVATHHEKSEPEKLKAMLEMMQATIRVREQGRIWPVADTNGLTRLLDATACGSTSGLSRSSLTTTVS
jgi:hypothetical protein